MSIRTLQIIVPTKVVFLLWLACLCSWAIEDDDIELVEAFGDPRSTLSLVEEWKGSWFTVLPPSEAFMESQQPFRSLDRLELWIQRGRFLPRNLSTLLSLLPESMQYSLDVVKKRLLLLAIQYRHLQAIKIFIEEDAQLKCKCINEYPLLSISELERQNRLFGADVMPAFASFFEIAELLLQLPNHTNNNQLHFAALYNQVEAIEFFTNQRHFDVNGRNEVGNTALHGAVFLGSANAVRRLLAIEGVDPNLPGKEGDCAIHFAAEIHNPLSMQHLLRFRGLNLDIRNGQNLNAEQLALQNGHDSIVRLITEERQRRLLPGIISIP